MRRADQLSNYMKGRIMLRNYTRWRATTINGALYADLLGVQHDIMTDPKEGKVWLNGSQLSPDEARLIGVRLIEAAALADGDRAIRRAPTTQEDEQEDDGS